MNAALAFFLILVVCLLTGLFLASLLIKRAPSRLQITNFRGQRIPAIGGLVLFCIVLGAAILAFYLMEFPLMEGDLVSSNQLRRDVFGTAIVGLGFFFLGALDDLSNAKAAKGFGGHLKALGHGQITGGIVKAGGGFAASIAVGMWWEPTLLLAILDGLLIALAANLFNLLDLRPGRAGKVFLVAWVPLAAVAMPSPYLFASAPVVGGILAWLPFDLKEKGALGDSGSNLLGGVLGAGVALQSPLSTKLAALALLITLNLLSEKISFTEAISRIPPLRWFDNLGRIREAGSKG